MTPRCHLNLTAFTAALLALILLQCSGTKKIDPKIAHRASAIRNTSLTVEKFVPKGLKIHSREYHTFQFKGRPVRLTLVTYGKLRDCPSGCFSSYICAIEDGNDAHLMIAFWVESNEKAIGAPTMCDGKKLAGETWPECTPKGLRHPLLKTKALYNFAKKEVGRGPFRHCVNRFMYDDPHGKQGYNPMATHAPKKPPQKK